MATLRRGETAANRPTRRLRSVSVHQPLKAPPSIRPQTAALATSPQWRTRRRIKTPPNAKQLNEKPQSVKRLNEKRRSVKPPTEQATNDPRPQTVDLLLTATRMA